MRLALVGDIHARWTEADTTYFNRSAYGGLLITGDLPGRNHRVIPVARRLAGLTLPTIVIPGNHDGPTALDVLSEALWKGMRSQRAATAMAQRVDALKEALGPVVLGGYSLHTLGSGRDAVDVVVCRPHAMDSRRLTFAPYLQQRFAVADLEASTARLQALIEASSHPLVLLAHNGPQGLGSEGADPWGLPLFGRDNGDTDLSAAIRYALDRGKPLRAVVAGHMHYRGRRPRNWQVQRDGVLYLNAARVPRIDRGGHHHLSLDLAGNAARCEVVLAQP